MRTLVFVLFFRKKTVVNMQDKFCITFMVIHAGKNRTQKTQMLNQFSFSVLILQLSPVTEVVWSTVSLKLAWEVRIAELEPSGRCDVNTCVPELGVVQSIQCWRPKMFISCPLCSDFCSEADLGVFDDFFLMAETQTQSPQYTFSL